MGDPVGYVPINSNNGQSRAGITGSAVASTSSPMPSRTFGWNNKEEYQQYQDWANLYTGYDKDFGLNSYYDYYFTGQDIQVFIDGLTDSADILPIYQFGYNIQQNKQPLYGFWSYTYDYMMRGTRIVTGAFSVITKSPGFMTEKVAKAAKVRADRANNSTLYPVRGLNEDETNIETYWRRNYDSNLDAGQKHLFSVHPPFNFVAVYGVQDTSIDFAGGADRAREVRQKFYSSTAMMTDINERLVDSDPDDNTMRILIENVELISRQTEYSPDGEPVMETYSFMARDVREAPVPIITGNSFRPGSVGTTGGAGRLLYR